MVSSSHEAMHRIFHHDSEMLGRTFRALGLSLPTPDTVAVLSGEATEIRPLERRIDTLLRCETADGDKYLVAVESQLKQDKNKPYTWTYYLAYLADKYRLPVLLLVICRDRHVASWAAQPIKHGVGDWAALTLRPIVVGPNNVPVIVDAEEARAYTPLTALSVLTHADEEGIGAILNALASALKTMDDPGEAFNLAELVDTGLVGTKAEKIWRQMMAMDTTFYRSPFSQQLRAEGREEESIKKLLRLLAKRGIAITEQERALVEGCTDLAKLDEWFDLAVTATSAAQVFDAA